MSHKATYWLATIPPTTITAGSFRVLFHLCDHHNDERDPEKACFPSQETLRRKTGLSNGGLNKCLEGLEACGLIERRRSSIPGTNKRRTYYVLGCDMAGQTPLSGDGGQTPLSGVTNSTPVMDKLHSSGEEPVRNLKRKNPPYPPKGGHRRKFGVPENVKRMLEENSK